MTEPDPEFISILEAPSPAGDTASAKAAVKPFPDRLPVLGLSDIVVFPGMVAPLLVESAPSVRLIDDVVAGDRFLVLVLQKNAQADNPTPEELHEAGCAARVLKMLKFPDGSVRVLVEGLRRCRLREFTAREPYLMAVVEFFREEPVESLELSALNRSAQQQFQEVINLSPALSDQVKIAAHNTEDPAKLADLIAPNLNLTLQERQELIAQEGVKERLARLLPLLSREIEVLTLGSKIQKEVASVMSKTQRDFFLREQIRAIQRELGETEPGNADLASLRDQIEKADLPEEPRKVARRELERLQQIPVNAAEYTVARNYLDWLIALPWSKSTEDQLDLRRAQRVLDEQHYGLGKVKDRLLEYLAVIKLKRTLKGPLLCLVGPPGVGKTSLGQSVADALGRRFVRIALGGMRDEAEIRGHRRTYVSALPGRILQSLRRAEVNNPVVLLDELDKVGVDHRGDPASALLEVLDPQQNRAFVDNYLEVPFDLSRVLFITTANWLDPVHPALRDRLEVLELPSYTTEEKIQIARRHLLPRQTEEHGLKRSQLKVPDATLRHLIEDYTKEAGVRNLEREIASLVRKTALRISSKPRTVTSVAVPPDALEQFLGPARFFSETAEAITECGIAMGLGWTPVGGDILFIEATRMAGKGQLILTGSLGEVMKESAHAALSYLRAQAAALGIDLTDYEKHDIHIHVPAGATPKDGPSAGVTLVTALASLLLHRRVRADLAMTGEISLRGRILPVGGIKEKVLAASRARLKHVILPERNRKDWKEVPLEVRNKMQAHFVSQLAELFPLALKKS